MARQKKFALGTFSQGIFSSIANGRMTVNANQHKYTQKFICVYKQLPVDIHTHFHSSSQKISLYDICTYSDKTGINIGDVIIIIHVVIMIYHYYKYDL